MNQDSSLKAAKGYAIELVFDGVAEFYAWMTWQPVWRAHCGSLVDWFPRADGPLRILDLGIGPGVSGIGIIDRLPDARLVGLDFSHRMLKVARRIVARERVRLSLTRADATFLPFRDGLFDVVTGHSFLYLVADRRAVVREAARVLRPGGRCVFLEPHQDGSSLAWIGMDGPFRFKLSMALWRAFSGGIGRFRRGQFEELLAGAFERTEVTSTLGGLGLIGVGSSPRSL